MEGKLLGKDINLYMMQKLDDESLFSFCLANKNMAKLCNNENFWRIRFIEKYGSEAAKYKPPQRKWKQHYLKMIVDLDTFSNNPWSFFGGLSWDVNTVPETVEYGTIKNLATTDNPEDELYHNLYWLLNLGDKVTISFPLYPGYYLHKTYTTGKTKENEKGYFSPADILKLIYDFYQEDVTDKEYQTSYNLSFPIKRNKRYEYLFGPSFVGFGKSIHRPTGETIRNLNII